MDRLIDRQMDNIEKAYESIPMGGKLEFSKSAIEGLYQVLKELKEYKKGRWLHPEDVAGNIRRIEALDLIIKDYGDVPNDPTR